MYLYELHFTKKHIETGDGLDAWSQKFCKKKLNILQVMAALKGKASVLLIRVLEILRIFWKCTMNVVIPVEQTSLEHTL